MRRFGRETGGPSLARHDRTDAERRNHQNQNQHGPNRETEQAPKGNRHRALLTCVAWATGTCTAPWPEIGRAPVSKFRLVVALALTCFGLLLHAMVGQAPCCVDDLPVAVADEERGEAPASCVSDGASDDCADDCVAACGCSPQFQIANSGLQNSFIAVAGVDLHGLRPARGPPQPDLDTLRKVPRTA